MTTLGGVLGSVFACPIPSGVPGVSVEVLNTGWTDTNWDRVISDAVPGPLRLPFLVGKIIRREQLSSTWPWPRDAFGPVSAPYVWGDCHDVSGCHGRTVGGIASEGSVDSPLRPHQRSSRHDPGGRGLDNP